MRREAPHPLGGTDRHGNFLQRSSAKVHYARKEAQQLVNDSWQNGGSVSATMRTKGVRSADLTLALPPIERPKMCVRMRGEGLCLDQQQKQQQQVLKHAPCARLVAPSLQKKTKRPCVIMRIPTPNAFCSGYSVETIERLFRRFRQVDPTDTASNGSSMQAVSATNQLLVIRERLQAGLSARLLELKTEMDKEFGTAFVDMESYLRTEKGARSCSHER